MIKNSQKTPVSHIHETRKNIGKVLNYMYLAGRPVKIYELNRNISLNKKQIYRALQFLRTIGSLTKEYQVSSGKNKGDPPIRQLIVSLTEKQRKNAKRYLKR